MTIELKQAILKDHGIATMLLNGQLMARNEFVGAASDYLQVCYTWQNVTNMTTRELYAWLGY